MLYCSKCQTENPDENKYCRECGERLQRIDQAAGSTETGKETQGAAPSHIDELEEADKSSGATTRPEEESRSIDVAVGEMLYQTFQLYEMGRLDEAMDKCREALRLNPESTSGHSLLGMIYEKKSEVAAAAGADEAAIDHLRSAMRQYERVIEINPNSIADAEKLRELRRRIQRWETPPEPSALQQAWEQSAEAIRRIPVPVLAGGSAAILVLIILLVIWSRGGTTPARPLVRAPAPGTQPHVTAAPAPTFSPPVSGPMQDLPFAPPPTAGQPAAPEETTVRQEQERERPPVVPPSVRLAPRRAQPSSPAPAVGESKPEEKTEPVPPSETAPAKKWEGSDLQMQGMALARQGKTREAIAMFQRAISAYQEQIKAGVDVDSANAGIRTCRHYIALLESE